MKMLMGTQRNGKIYRQEEETERVEVEENEEG